MPKASHKAPSKASMVMPVWFALGDRKRM